MAATLPPAPRNRRPRNRSLWWTAAVAVVAVAAVVTTVVLLRHRPPPTVALPLRQVAEITLPGDSSRFDYASLDPDRGLLFIAHLESLGSPS